MSAPEKIKLVMGYGGEYRESRGTAGHEYTRTDLIPALIEKEAKV